LLRWPSDQAGADRFLTSGVAHLSEVQPSRNDEGNGPLRAAVFSFSESEEE